MLSAALLRALWCRVSDLLRKRRTACGDLPRVPPGDLPQTRAFASLDEPVRSPVRARPRCSSPTGSRDGDPTAVLRGLPPPPVPLSCMFLSLLSHLSQQVAGVDSISLVISLV